MDINEQESDFGELLRDFQQVIEGVDERLKGEQRRLRQEEREAKALAAVRQVKRIVFEVGDEVVARLNEKVRARESGSGLSAAGQVVDRYYIESGGTQHQVSQAEYERHERAEQSAATGNCACCNNTG